MHKSSHLPNLEDYTNDEFKSMIKVNQFFDCDEIFGQFIDNEKDSKGSPTPSIHSEHPSELKYSIFFKVRILLKRWCCCMSMDEIF